MFIFTLIMAIVPWSMAVREVSDTAHRPFLGVPAGQNTVETEEGGQLIRLRRKHTHRKKKVGPYSEDAPEAEWFSPGRFYDMKEKLIGKTEETKELEELLEFLKSRTKKKPHLRAAGDPYTLENTLGFNFEYLLQLYCGSEAVEMSVTFDTGSDWVILQSENCNTCEGDVWDETASTSYTETSNVMSAAYGSAYTEGYEAYDDFYFDNSAGFGTTNFEFMIIYYQEGIAPSGGIMGFSRDFPFVYSGGSYDHGPLFYYAMYDDSVISDLVFASYIADDPVESFFQIGDYDKVGTYYDGDLVWIDMTDDFFWLTTSSSMIYDGVTHSYAEIGVELDTGTSLAYLDNENGYWLQRQILKGHRGFKFMGTVFTKCDMDMFSSFFVEMDGYYFEMPPSSYIRRFDQFGYWWCELGIDIEESDVWLVGDVFFRNYYNVWDEANSRVGWAIRTGSDATVEPYAA